MGWRFRKSFGFGPIRTTFSQGGVGKSIGFWGFRWGVTPDGKKYWSFGIRGSGFFYIKYY